MSKKVAWFVPSPLEGSGGHRTIFQNVNALHKSGYECHVYVEDNGQASSDEGIKKLVEKYFGKIDSKIYLGFNAREKYDLIFATAWFTAKYVRDVPQDCKKAYFIQDFEAYFNPMGDGYLLAENTYKYDLIPVTIGKWLSHKMICEFSKTTNYFDFCADNTVYYKDNTVKKEKAICFIYQPEKPRRCSALGIEALGIVKHLMPDVKIYLYGSKAKTNVWFEHTNLELMPIHECNKLYNKSTVGLCISSSNPSRIPFEMMAAGLPVVDIYRENNLYDMPDSGVVLADPTPESIAQALMEIIKDQNKREKMSDFGTDFMRNKSLEYGFKQFVDSVDRILIENNKGEQFIPKIYNKDPLVADVYTFKKATNISVGEFNQNSHKDKLKSLLRRVKRKLKL